MFWSKLQIKPFIIFFRESFNLWRPLLMISLYNQTKTTINFWCRRELNPKSLIQPSETLLIKLIETYPFIINLFLYSYIYIYICHLIYFFQFNHI